MQKAFLVILLLFLCGKSVFAQNSLLVYPKSIEFMDPFHRLSNIHFVNNSDSAITIKDISYNSGAYFVRFNKFWYYPIILQPHDTLLMDCILRSDYVISSSDDADTMSVFTDNSMLLAKISIKINYHDNVLKGAVAGHISDGMNPISGAKVFFYSKNLLVQTTITDDNGYYSAQLKPGSYKISAQQDSFYVTFYGQQHSPYNASQILISSESLSTADIVLTKMAGSGISVGGQVYDAPTSLFLRRGIVVIRAGTHTPSKARSNTSVAVANPQFYSAVIQWDGTYKLNNLPQQGYYYIQALSDYYVPSYYNSAWKPVAYWQKADSILINGQQTGINVFLARDSAFGNGNISGKILLNNSSDTSSEGNIVLVQSLSGDSSIVAYSFTDITGNYTVSNLQYGEYRLIAQKIGYDDVFSGVIDIDSLNSSINGINMNFSIAGIVDNPRLINNFELFQNYPNPFNPSTSIEYSLPYGTTVRIRVINILGQEVSLLANGYYSAGIHRVVFNGSRLASGIYFVNLIAGGKAITRKIVLMK